MRLRLPWILPVAVLVVVGVLGTATMTLAAGGGAPAAPPAAPAAAPAPAELVVPDVTRQAYVFAKGTLEDAGFAWRVEGAVQGYASNTVSSQSPAAGTRVLDTGTPEIALRLTRGSYAEDGAPENRSLFKGTPIRLAEVAAVKTPVAATPKAAAEPATKPKAPKQKVTVKVRVADFIVPGAPPEPFDEITLVKRAERLSAWVDAHRTVSNANVSHWLYQHSWIVTGARFGWWHGEEALVKLIEVDRTVQSAWGIGSRSEALARAALAEVRTHKR
jgi:hypothetical protein